MPRSRNVDDLDALGLPSELDGERAKGDQLSEILESLARRLGPGAALPSERHLATRYGVARMTVRQEIRRLAADGVLTIRQGAGAFVADPAHPALAAGYSFSREVLASGRQPGSVLLEHNVLLVTSRSAELLGVETGTRALRIVRLRTVDDEPVCIERTTLPLARFPGLEEYDFGTESLYAVIREQYGIRPYLAKARASAVLPAPDEAELLGIGEADPCLLVTSMQTDAGSQVIEAGRSIYRGDRFDLDVGRLLTSS